jgi:hypothetical protein
LRRAGADPKAIAKLEVLGMGGAGEPGAVDSPVPIPSAAPSHSLFDAAPQRPPVARPRTATVRAQHRPPRSRRSHTPVTPLGGFEMGDRFRLSEPPEISEPRGPLSFSVNWLAAAALVGAAAYHLMR